MRFSIINEQQTFSVDNELWTRAFRYGARELGIENFACGIMCVFVPFTPPKIQPMSLGNAKKCVDGVIIFMMTPHKC